MKTAATHVTLDFPTATKYGPAEQQAAQSVLSTGRLSDTARGTPIATVEDAFAQLTGSAYALSFNSGTAALHAALHAAGAHPDAGVATSPLTWISAITAAFHAGSFPVLCDLERHTYHLSPAAAATANCSAVLVTHAYGTPAPMDLYRTDVPVIEDCSHAHGAIHHGRPVGAWGTAGCFSLQDTKTVSGGEGGILTTSDRRIYEGAMLLGHHPHRLATEIAEPDLAALAATGAAHKFRMSPIAAAIAAVQVASLPQRMAAAEGNLATAHEVWQRQGTPLHIPPIGNNGKRGWYGVPLMLYDDAGEADEQLLDRLTAARVPVRRIYEDWLTSPLLQTPQAVRSFWPQITNWQPPQPAEFPNYYHTRRHTIVLKIPMVDAPDYMQQVALALDTILSRR
ncbi:MAG TPA: DegT/DnrJ/EryC1/StrS family aminotransferase [Candidatus Limnocylindrales bacterium]|nr:DegT/DnrJ/EryC1/StrS family aminotransferase [Candidatus Limnocylindrales bacterium]